MIARCTKPDHVSYHRYGGRGIKVCRRWLNSFSAFEADMGVRPGINYSIDRIDNNKGYYKKNCRWATIGQQNQNRSDNLILTLNGETMIASRWAEKLGISLTSILYRVQNWSNEDALSVRGRRPVRGARHKLSKLTDEDVIAIRDARGRGEKLTALAKQYGVSQSLVSKIYKRKTWKHV